MDKKTVAKDTRDFLSKLFLFENLSGDSLEALVSETSFEIFEYEANEKIYSPDDFESKVGFVMSGECSVERIKADGTSIPLNRLFVGEPFGILAVFSKKGQFPTLVRAVKKTKVLFFDKEAVLFMVENYPSVSLAIISFMSDRIEFLNNKVATFSADSVEEKFILYLIEESKKADSLSISLNLAKTARILNAGRASVYRAIESLEKLSLIKLENKKIIISDLEGLERITK